ncbi:hypothetical protein FOL88_03225, partial [Lactobacillus reuteri]
MAENSQLSGETKNDSTGTSSTDVSSAVIGNHENAVVPHKISNHDKLVQTMVMVDGEWINVNDTNDQANMKEDMHKVNKKVVEAQKGIVEAKNAADSAVKYADSAVSVSKVNSDAIIAQSSAISEAKAATNSATAEIQQVTASVDGLQSTVASKADESQVTQLSNLVQSKVSSSDFNSKITQLANDINLRVTKGDLLSQINVEAGRTLIQSNKIYFDADSFVMSPNSKAFIPSAYITEINADKITTGTLDAAKFNVKNFSADNIVGGTLNGVVVKTGVNDRYFQTSKDNIYWVRKGSMSLVGNDTYLNSA